MQAIATIDPSWLTCALLFLATSGYAYRLEKLHVEPRWTWLTVIVGVAVVGCFVGLRFFAFNVEIPLLSLQNAAAGNFPALVSGIVFWVLVWSFEQWVLHFIIGAIPIVIWQVWQDRANLEAALRDAIQRLKERKDDGAS